MFIVLLGAPGSGKGTAGKILAEDLKLTHIATGDIFRENLKNETELGKEAKSYIDKGELVPDKVTISMISERLKRPDVVNGAILDGFPRTVVQAESLHEMLDGHGHKVDIALNIDVPFDEIVTRIANRRSCRNCDAIYNIVFNPPKQEGICDTCGGELYQREDQKPEVVQNRLDVYKNTAEGLISYYKEQDVLYNAKSGDSIGKNTYDVVKEVENYLQNK